MKDLELYLPKAKEVDTSICSFSEVIGDTPTPWKKDDIITFPQTIEGNAFKTKIGNRMYEYIVVTVKSDDDSEHPARFFPSLFRRRARRCRWEMVDGVAVAIPTNDFIIAGGSIVDHLYSKKSRVNDVITAILGKSIRISAVYEIESQEFGTTKPKLQKVYDFEPEGWTIDA